MSISMPTRPRGTTWHHSPGGLVGEVLHAGHVGLAFQPVFDLRTGRLVSAEALVRADDSRGRSVPAAKLVASAEATGAIHELGRVVLGLAVRQLARWRATHGRVVPVAVNVSALQVQRRGFAAEVLEALAAAHVPHTALTLELTESVLLPTGERARRELDLLVAAGVRLAIDDFGTGFASLPYLLELPATTVKIDQSFLRGVPHDGRAAAIVAGVAALAERCGTSCVAEGIETPEQLAFLGELGVLGQGHLLGRAVGADHIEDLLAPDREGRGRAAWSVLPAADPIAC